jgi:hypothetical protein
VGTDPWSQFLDWLDNIIIPNWSELIGLLPILLVLGVLGPALSLIALLHLHHRFTRKRGRIRVAEAFAEAAPRDEAGQPVFAPNVPFCAEHALVYPGQSRTCDVDGAELSVRCPVDSTTRRAGDQVCRSCGTKYVLAAGQSPLVVRRNGRPPEGGAAVA